MHTFVGHFIGSPGMNFLPCTMREGKAMVAGNALAASNGAAAKGKGRLELGIRPEFVRFAKKGVAAQVVRVSDIGHYRVVETRVGPSPVKLVVPEGQDIPTGAAHLAFDAKQTHVYRDGWLAGARA